MTTLFTSLSIYLLLNLPLLFKSYTNSHTVYEVLKARIPKWFAIPNLFQQGDQTSQS